MAGEVTHLTVAAPKVQQRQHGGPVDAIRHIFISLQKHTNGVSRQVCKKE